MTPAQPVFFAFVLAIGPAPPTRCDNSYDASTGPTPLGHFYVKLDCPTSANCPTGYVSVWIYEESNGIPGLQREDEFASKCNTYIPADVPFF